MNIKILGKVPDSLKVQDFVRYLDFKNCPKLYCNTGFVEKYKEAGELYGVRWDLALCQSILETGRFHFQGSSINAMHYNYAGISATDFQPDPEQFKNPSEGIEAQMQILAIRAGFNIGRQNMISKRYQKYYDHVFGKAETWDKLAGTWASDLEYWDKIQKIAHEFEVLTGNVILENYEPEDDDKEMPTWFEFNRYDDGIPSIIGYAGSKPLIESKTNNVEILIELLKRYKHTAKTFLVADRDKKIPDIGDLDNEDVPPVHRDSERIGGQKLKWIPFAERYGKIKTKGKYKDLHPQGATIHHSAGRSENPKGMLDYLASKNYPCLAIGHDGTVYQSFPLDEWGWHDGSSHSRIGVGIEVCSGGRLSGGPGRWVTWFGKKVPDGNVRVIPKQQDNQQPGGYEKWTEAQIESLIQVLCWLKHNAPDVFSFDLVKGHDELTPANKNDPGGSMPYSMPEFRSLLEERYWETYQRNTGTRPLPLLPVLKRGDKGTHVKKLQTMINEHIEHKITVDGDFGYLTELAVMHFQLFKGIEIDGIVGPITYASVKKDYQTTWSREACIEKVCSALAKQEYHESNGSYNFFRHLFFDRHGQGNWAWCAATVHKIESIIAGKPLDLYYKTAAKNNLALVFAWYQIGKHLDCIKSKPKPGSIVIYDWANNGTYDHIGYVKEVHSNGDISAYEGNYKNRYAIARRAPENVKCYLELPHEWYLALDSKTAIL